MWRAWVRDAYSHADVDEAVRRNQPISDVLGRASVADKVEGVVDEKRLGKLEADEAESGHDGLCKRPRERAHAGEEEGIFLAQVGC